MAAAGRGARREELRWRRRTTLSRWCGLPWAASSAPSAWPPAASAPKPGNRNPVTRRRRRRCRRRRRRRHGRPQPVSCFPFARRVPRRLETEWTMGVIVHSVDPLVRPHQGVRRWSGSRDLRVHLDGPWNSFRAEGVVVAVAGATVKGSAIGRRRG